jgi:hypothetical protein
MEISRDLLAAIGEVVVEATKLEFALARVVCTRWGWSDQDEVSMIKRSGCVRDQLRRLAQSDSDWLEFRQLQRDASAVLEDRHVLAHSVVLIVSDDDEFEPPKIELWHPKSNTTAEMPPTHAVEEHAFDIGRCFKAAVRLIPEAAKRLEEFGASTAPNPPKPLP